MFRRNQTAKSPRPESAPPQSDDGVARIAIAEDGRVIYASDAFCAIAHLPAAQAQNAPVSALMRFDEGESIDTIHSGLHRVFLNGHKNAFEFHFDWMVAPDERRYLVGSQALKKQAPSQASMKEFVASAVRRRGAESGGAQDLRNFTDMSRDVMIVTSGGQILHANRAFHDLFGTDDAGLAALDFIALFEDEDRPHIRATMQTLSLDGGTAQAVDFQARVKTPGGTRWLEWRQRRAAGSVYSIGRDITATKQQEEALSRREKQLLQAESIGRMGHWQWTIGQDAIEWSQEIFRIFGVEEGTFRPTLESMNRMINRRDISRVNQAFQRAVIERNDYDVEFRVNRPDGEVRFIRCEGRCARDAEGDVIALYGIMQDMTERMAHENGLREAKEAAERAYAAKSQFLANMSHELRTPLNAIIGFSEMMQRQLLGPIGTEKYLDYITGIRESGEHLLDLISDILDMSKIEAGKYDLDLAEVNVSKAIGMAVHMMQGRAIEAKVTVTAAPAAREDLLIVADRRAFMQILLNLLSNAVKFTEEGGQVRVECYERKEYLAIKVADNGIGIPANKLAQITKPFEQASSSYARDHQGSGLGLAITKELTEMHGGMLFIDSTQGIGTTVSVRLPYDASKAKKATGDAR